MCPPNCTDTISRPGVASRRVWLATATVVGDAVRHHMEWLLDTLRVWRRRARERRYLAGMDERLLKDIGVTPLDARREAERRFWQAPTLDETARGRPCGASSGERKRFPKAVAIARDYPFD